MKIGIDLGGTNVRIGQVVNGTVINKQSLPSPGSMSLEDSLIYLKKEIRPFITPAITGIGIGVPSVVDVENGIVYNVANIPSWVEVPLRKIFMDEFGVPVFINNDCNCFVMGEKTYGKGQPYKNLIGITLGTGVGAGLIIHDRLYNGRNTGAGEIGCMAYLDHNYEYYCASEFFVHYYQTTGKMAAEKARNGNQEALAMWEKFGSHLGNLMQAVLFAYDPEAIVIGGGISTAYDLFQTAMWEQMKEFPYPETIKNIRILISNHPDISILGAAALVAGKD